MKASLEFNLDDPEDSMAHLRCVKALDLCLVLWDLLASMRSTIKYSDDDAAVKVAEVARTQLLELMDKHGIVLDDLIN